MKVFKPGDPLAAREDFNQVPNGALICCIDKLGWKTFYQKLGDFWTPDYFDVRKREFTLDELLVYGDTFTYGFSTQTCGRSGNGFTTTQV